MDVVFLSETALFQRITPREIQEMLGCLGAHGRRYPKGAYILHGGDVTRSLGVVLSGSANIERDDLWGNKTILGHVSPGQIFAEAYACIPGEPMMVDVVADEATEVLFLDVGRVLQVCPSACRYHTRLIRNLLSVTAQKNLELSRRIQYTAPRTIRDRLLSYLSDEAARQDSRSVVIPFNRQQLADYLNVDRSALSAELGKMRREGLMAVRKNYFELLF